MFVPPAEWDVYKRGPGLVLGFHGCDKAVGLDVLAGQKQLHHSTNDYDWLGSGVYFWEADPWRALEFAQACSERRHLTRGRVDEPYVVGAVLDLGHCCNLFEIQALAEVKLAHEYLTIVQELIEGKPLPVNKGFQLGMRYLDKAVLEAMHKLRESERLPPYASVRAPFIEGERLYDTAGFKNKNHIQIAIRDPACIRGYFRLPGL